MNIPAWLLQIGIYLFNMLDRLYEYLMSLYKKIWRASRYYMFIKGIPYPYKYGGAATGAHDIVYDMDTQVFFPFVDGLSLQEVEAFGEKKSLPVLSLTIVHKNTSDILFDLTDYLEKIRYVRGVIPTIGQLIAVWQLYSTALVDPEMYRVNYMNSDGEERTTDLRSMENIA